MFVAWRDLRFARGRFTLIGAVVALITLLVGFLGGLTVGLADANISALTGMHTDRFVFAQPSSGDTVSFSDSALTESDYRAWSSAAGMEHVAPIGISMTSARADGQHKAAVAAFGITSAYGPVGAHGQPVPRPGHVVLSSQAADDLHVAAGDTIRLAVGEVTVQSVFGDAQYSHASVMWMPLAQWHTLAARTGQGTPFATVLAVTGDSAAVARTAAATHTEARSLIPSLMAIDSFRSEIGSLLMMMALLFGISALVIGAFFTVWTMQRAGDIAVLKALGATTGSLVRDCLGQALVVLVGGVAVGIGITAGVGGAISGSVPFVVGPLTTLLPATVMIILGLTGAAFALRSVTTADPLTALGSRGA